MPTLGPARILRPLPASQPPGSKAGLQKHSLVPAWGTLLAELALAGPHLLPTGCGGEGGGGVAGTLLVWAGPLPIPSCCPSARTPGLVLDVLVSPSRLPSPLDRLAGWAAPVPHTAHPLLVWSNRELAHITHLGGAEAAWPCATCCLLPTLPSLDARPVPM